MAKDITYDQLVIELQKEGKSLGSISIKKSDIDTLINLHDQTFEEVVGNMAKTLEDGITERSKNN